ncbi:hypothetical protein [Rhizobium paknamense]|uniref:Uncharacterized protein n=1 Tax=Rhizobium paknamense TaxID=1206817 RepID=A0ABU0IDI2_9HYPH|nr:hypothetical protein [Rhizobium paknamense]MDQ0455274.1 hypothetical protein [Rhizobium paknamense]
MRFAAFPTRQNGVRFLALSLLLAAFAPQAGAEDDGKGRFRMLEKGDSVIRLDTETGAMSICQEKDGELLCRLGADERQAYQEDMERLEKRVEALEKKAAVSGGGVPSDEEVDRSLSIMERMMRRFFGLIEEFRAFPGKVDAGFPPGNAKTKA